MGTILIAIAAILSLCTTQAEAFAGSKASAGFSPTITQALKSLSHGVNVWDATEDPMSNYPVGNLRQMTAMGVTYVRVPVEVDRIVAGTPLDLGGVSTQAQVDTELTALDGVVAGMLNNGFAVTLCVFTTPGFAALPTAQSWPILAQANRVLSARYGHLDTARVFLEVLNEPHMTPAQWNMLAPRLVAAARKSSPANTIIVDAAWNAIPTNLPFLNPVRDQNVIYNMHVYQPALLTGQGSATPVDPNYLFPRPAGETGPPGSLISQEWTPAKLAAYVMSGISWAHQRGLPLTMNEFGISALCDPQSEVNWLSFMRQITDDNGVPWAFWGYHHLFPDTLAGQTPDYDPVMMAALGPTPPIIDFGINFKALAAAPFFLVH